MKKYATLLAAVAIACCARAFADEWEINAGQVYHLEYRMTPEHTVKVHVPLQTVTETTVLKLGPAKNIVQSPAVPLGPAVTIEPAMDFHNVVTLYLPFGELPVKDVRMCIWCREASGQIAAIPAEQALIDMDHGVMALEITKSGTYQVGAWESLNENWPPSAFFLKTPVHGAVFGCKRDDETLQFSWQKSVDPNNDPVFYHIVFAHDAELGNRIASLYSGQENHFTASIASLETLLGDLAGQAIFWGVEARDNETCTISGQTHSLVFSQHGCGPRESSLIFDYGEKWSYNDGDNLDSKSWKSLEYDDSGWKTGNGLFGFGYWYKEKPVTVLASSRVTYYFRKKIALDEKPDCLTARVKYDDGFAFYVNGREVYRHNVRANPGYGDYADSKSSSLQSFTISGEHLVPGDNILAVEVHQSDIFSSDIAMDVRLENGHNSVSLTWGPWLALPVDNTMTVVWETSEPADGELHYGVTPSLENVVRQEGATTYHKLVATGLMPQTTYHYEVTSAGVHSAVKTFRTPPDRNGEILVGLYGDTRTDYSTHQVVIEAMAKNNPSLILNSGDIAEKGNNIAQWYEQFLNPARKVVDHIPVVGCRGNHDGSVAGNLWKFFPISPKAPAPGEMYYYSFTYGPLAVLVIDTDAPYAKGSRQYSYIEADLQKFSGEGYWMLAMFHRPAYSSGVGHGGAENPKIAEDIVPMLERYGADLAINGHDHFYERSFKDGVHHIVAGGGGATPAFGNFNINSYKVYNKSFVFCYSLLAMTPYGYTLTTFTPEGKKLDEVSRDGRKPQIHILQPDGSVEKLDSGKGKYCLTGPKEAFTARRASDYRIYFNAEDRDDNARIAIYLDRDNAGQDGILAGEVYEDHSRYFDWRVPENFPVGTYYVYAVITDGTGSAWDYSHFTVQVE